MTNHNADTTILALDVGAARIGVASANTSVRIASPLTFLVNHPDINQEIAKLVTDQKAVAVVVGLPRGLDGQETDQTRTVLDFVNKLKNALSLPVHLQDEALTSRQAEDELEARGKTYSKGDIDALAACYILTDYLNENTKG